MVLHPCFPRIPSLYRAHLSRLITHSYKADKTGAYMKPNRKKQGISRKGGSEKNTVSDYRLIFVLGGAIILAVIMIAVIIFTLPA